MDRFREMGLNNDGLLTPIPTAAADRPQGVLNPPHGPSLAVRRLVGNRTRRTHRKGGRAVAGGETNKVVGYFRDALRVSPDFRPAEANLTYATELRHGRPPEPAPPPRQVER